MALKVTLFYMMIFFLAFSFSFPLFSMDNESFPLAERRDALVDFLENPLQVNDDLEWRPEPFFSQKVRHTPYAFRFNMEESAKMALARSFESRIGLEHLYQTHLKIFERASDLLPHLSLSIGVSNPIVGLESAFFALFGVFVPSNWFDLFAAKEEYKSQLYATTSLLFTQYSMLEQLYIQIHKIEIHLEIVKHYLAYLQKVLEQINRDQVPKNRFDRAMIEGFYYSLNTRTFELAYSIYELLPDYSKALGFSEKMGYLDIDGLKLDRNFALPIPSYEKLITKVLDRSFELKSLKHLIKERRNWQGGRIVSFFNISDKIHIDIGGSTFIQPFKIQSDIRILEIQKEKSRAEISAELKKVLYRLHLAQDAYKSATYGANVAQHNLKKKLDEYLSAPVENRDISGFLYIFDLALIHQLKLNETRHNSFLARSQLNRLTLEHYDEISMILSKDKHFKKISLFMNEENSLFKSNKKLKHKQDNVGDNGNFQFTSQYVLPGFCMPFPLYSMNIFSNEWLIGSTSTN